MGNIELAIKRASRKAGISKYLNPKIINQVLSIIRQNEEKLDEKNKEKIRTTVDENGIKLPLKLIKRSKPKF